MTSVRDSSQTVKTFYVLDFDRCIGDTAKFHEVLIEVVERLTPIVAADIEMARQESEQSGGSFDTASFVTGILAATRSVVTWDDICNEMIASARQRDMLEPHARDLLRLLDDRDALYGILTYGGREWQRTKLLAANLADVPYMITDVHEKGRSLARWQLPDGSFAIPEELSPYVSLTADTVVLIDDKAASFRNIPLGVYGYHVVWADRELLPSQAGVLPEGVVTAHGMVGVIELLFGSNSLSDIDRT